MKDREVDFIARHYRKGKFSPYAGWRRLGIAPPYKWRRYRVAAAVAATVVLSAAATILYREYQTHRVYNADDAAQQSEPVIPDAVTPLAEVRVIDFENAHLPDVVEKIESVYGVKVNGIPASPEEYVLSLHYEGTPADLISVINDILGTQMTVAER